MVSPSEQAPPAETTGSAAVASDQPGRLRRFLGSLTGRTRMRRARSRLPSRSKEQGELLSRARLASELGRRLLEPSNPSRHGRGFDVAADLYRQAAYWALLAFSPDANLPSPAVLWETSKERIAMLAVASEELAEVERTFCAESPFTVLANRQVTEQRASAELMRGFAERLLDEHDGPFLELARARTHRVLRLALLAGLILACAAAGIYSVLPDAQNLAEGKPWRTSSELYPCYPEKPDCGGFRTLILFHTREESNPWFEIDLEEKTRFSSLTIRNRTDFGPERAVPLAVEVSNDGKTYRTVAVQPTSFTTWTPEFPPQEARYIRLRAMKNTFLHLEKVEVHP